MCIMSRDICNYDMGALGPRLWRNSPDGFNMSIANGAGLDDMKAVKRIVPNRCCGVIVDLQGFFLSQVDKRLGSRIKTNTGNLVRLLNHLGRQSNRAIL